MNDVGGFKRAEDGMNDRRIGGGGDRLCIASA